MAATQTDQKKLLEPKEPLVTVSRNKPANFFVYIAKIHLEEVRDNRATRVGQCG